jgi:ribose transport system substrate-binding protein
MRRFQWGGRSRSAVMVLLCVSLWAGCQSDVPAPDPSAGGGASGGSVEDWQPVVRTMSGAGQPTVAYVTNGIASFWVIAEAGARQAGKEFDARVEVRMPPEGVPDQRRMLEELLTMGVDGIAVSPIDPANETDILNTCAEQTNLITHDSDAPDAHRLCYIGMSNYTAGRMCGNLVRQAMPSGGKLMIFVGRLEQDNARLRRQGVIDELLGRANDESRFDPPGQALEGNGFTILGTQTDGFDFGKAKSQAEDALAAHPDLGCMVGLFAYNPPLILEALKGADKLGQVQVVGFDEADETLQAIVDGHCFGTVVQNPYRYGYESVRVLAALARGDESVIPESRFLDVPARSITRENAAEFWAELKALVEGNK